MMHRQRVVLLTHSQYLHALMFFLNIVDYVIQINFILFIKCLPIILALMIL